MSHLDDDQIRASLGRRSSAGLAEVERANILRAARVRALAPRRRLLPRFAGWLAATAAVAVLVVIAVPVLLSSPVPVARASSPGATQTPAPVLHISNETALQLTVLINGRVAEKAAPNSESIVDPTPYSEPWHVTVTTDSGRQLVQLTYGASDVWYTSNSAHGVAQRWTRDSSTSNATASTIDGTAPK